MDVTLPAASARTMARDECGIKHTRRARQAQPMGQDNWRSPGFGASGQPSARQAASPPS